MILFTNHTFSMALDDDAIPDVLERISGTVMREEIERKWTAAARDDPVPLQWKEACALFDARTGHERSQGTRNHRRANGGAMRRPQWAARRPQSSARAR